MGKKKNQETAPQSEVLLLRLIELTEKSMIISLYFRGANRDLIKSVVGVGTEKADNVISKLKKLKRGK